MSNRQKRPFENFPFSGFISAVACGERVRTEREESTTYNGIYHVYSFGNINYLQYQKQHQQMHLQQIGGTATGPCLFPSAVTAGAGARRRRSRAAPA